MQTSHRFYLFLVFLVYHSLAFSNNLEPDQLIRNMSESFESALIENQQKIKQDPELTRTLIVKHIYPNIHFELLSRFVLGKNWKKSSESEQQEFVHLFSELLIRFYSKSFTEFLHKYQLQKGIISFLPYHSDTKDKYVRVKTTLLINPDKPPVKVNYSLYLLKSGDWKIYDISIEGISLVTSYRSSFNQIIQKEGMSGLIKHLKTKIENGKLN